ncbi:MAG: HAMP domain-containing sensor histidine kinase [Cytophagales bacterium]|nr:HAMP domain-containing sensor histidine kinase [Cytophagales bacterium]
MNNITRQTELFFEQEFKTRRKVIIHKLAIVCILVSVAATIPYLILSHNTIALLNGTIIIVFILALVLNYYNKSESATIITYVCVSVLLFLVSSITGWKSMEFLFCFPMVIAIPTIVDPNNRNLLGLHLMLPILSIMLLIFTDSKLLYDSYFDIVNISVVGYFNLIFVLLICTFFVFAMVKNHSYSEHTLKKSEISSMLKNDELTKINKELDTFVYSLSHDIRAPVASALGLIYLLKNATDMHHAYVLIERLELSMKSLDKFIKDVLDYSKNNRLSLKIEPINFEEIIQEIINFNLDRQKQNDIHINVKVNQPYEFHTDKYRLKIALNNLISNAIRYHKVDNPHKYIHINVDVKPRDASLKVADNGIGIDKKDFSRIFEMFYRGDDTNTQYHGTGLGLYITREAITKIRGTIELQSEPNIGTEFSINIKNLGGFYKYFEWGKAKNNVQG